jgi:hypothetical protein
MTSQRLWVMGAIVGLSAMFTACGGGPKGESMPEMDNLPAWVMNQPPLCGVGIQKFRGNVGSAKSFAESSAREDLSRQLETRVKSMIKQYNQEGGTEDGDISEELSTRASVTLSKQTLNGAVPKKSDMRDNQFYSLVCLEPDALTDAINNMKILNNAQRKALARRAAAAHKELNEAMENYDK